MIAPEAVQAEASVAELAAAPSLGAVAGVHEATSTAPQQLQGNASMQPKQALQEMAAWLDAQLTAGSSMSAAHAHCMLQPWS